MPRQSRIDAPGAWYHIIAHEIGRCKIFNGDLDRDNFVERLDTVNGSYYIFLFFIFRRAVVFHLMFGADALTKKRSDAHDRRPEPESTGCLSRYLNRRRKFFP